MLTAMKAIPLVLTLTVLAGCSSVRNVRVVVRDAQTDRPAEGVRVRAISLDSGTVPLPLNDDTIDEILSIGSIAEASTTNADGAARLRLRGRVPHVVELVPPPLGPGAPAAGDRVHTDRYLVSRDLKRVRLADGAAPNAFVLEIVR
ncbi:MAG: hypothetical protein ACTS27_04650 [Phycisphaerales bacterium]